MSYYNSYGPPQPTSSPFVGSGGGTNPQNQQMGSLRRLDSTTVRTHFYPEGGWGWIVCACAFLAHVTTSGAQLSAGALHIVVANKFQDNHNAHWLGPFSWSVSSMCSPLVVNLCRRKNVRVVSLVGGCLFPLSLLFTSFATEIHQFFFCFGLMGGIGSCLVRESSTIVLGEYFRKRRQFAEQVVLAGTGVGVTLFSLLYLSLSRHIEWSHGFQIGAGLSLISAILPAFYRAAAHYHPQRALIQQLKQQKAQRQCTSFFIPLGGDICKSLKLFCVPSLKPVLWSAGISSFGLYAPAFLMSDFGKSEGLTGGSLLLLQTHLGLGLSLGVILGAILTLKKFRCCHVSPRMLCCSTGILTGLSMIAISSVKGYYGYSLSAWIYGIALGSYIYTLKILCMDLTRTKHWERIWSCVQSIMGPGCLIGTGLTSYLGKSSFYACATCVLLGSGIIGLELIDLSKCGSPQLSSEDNESPIPPAPPPIKTSAMIPPTTVGFHPLRRSMSLQQPMYPYYSENEQQINPLTSNLDYSPFCPDCNPPSSIGSHYPPTAAAAGHMYPPPMVRSFSQPQFKNTGTQTHPNTPEPQPRQRGRGAYLFSQSSSSFDQIPFHHPFHPNHVHSHVPTTTTRTVLSSQSQSQQQQQQPTTSTLSKSSQKYSVMFASNPQLFPEHVHIPQIHNQPSSSTASATTAQKQKQKVHVQITSESNKLQQESRIKSTTSSARSSTERFPDIPIEPQFGHFIPHQNQEPAFTRHYFDSSQMLPPHKRQEKLLQQQQVQQRQQQQLQQQQPQPPLPPQQAQQQHHYQNQLPLSFQHSQQNNISHSHSPHQLRHNNPILQQQQQQAQGVAPTASSSSSILNPTKLFLPPNPIIQAQHYSQPHQHISSSNSNNNNNHHLHNHNIMNNPISSRQQPILYYNPQSEELLQHQIQLQNEQIQQHHYNRPSSVSHHQQHFQQPQFNPNFINTNHSHQQQQQQQQQSHHQRRNSFNAKTSSSSHHSSKNKNKVSSQEFDDIEEPKFHSLRKPILQQQPNVSTITMGKNSGEYVLGGPSPVPAAPYYYIDRTNDLNSSTGLGGNEMVHYTQQQQFHINTSSTTSQSQVTRQQQLNIIGRNSSSFTSREFDS